MKIATVLFVVLAVCGATSAGQIIYVDADAKGANDGTSWADAYNYLQDALAVASSGDEIWVAEGIYKPDQGNGITPGDRNATFQLINSVAVKGGYAGFRKPNPDARDINEYETILSGDLNDNDAEISDPEDLLYEPTRAENSYHVVTGSNTDTTALLDGFTITGGNANGSEENSCGGGIFCYEASTMISNCTFSGNSAWGGGGVFNWSNSRPRLTNCTFRGNAAWVFGGGMRNYQSSPTLTNCTFIRNEAEISGGGMNNYRSSPTLTNCIFSNNSAVSWYGGGMNNFAYCHPKLTNCAFSENYAGYAGGGIRNNAHCSSTLTNCVFSGNWTFYFGGGMANNSYCSLMLINCMFSENKTFYSGGGVDSYRSNSLTMTNCTFTANSAPYGNALACDSYRQRHPSSIRVTNCIFWNGWDEIWNNDGSTITITYSDVRGSWAGEGNINTEPLFVEPAVGDYHLLPGSPCIDAGDNTAVPADTTDLDGDGNTTEPIPWDLDGYPRIVGDWIDMGAYEYSFSIPVEVDIMPETLNLTSQGRWITCRILLPENHDVADIDPNSIRLDTNGVLPGGKIAADQMWFEEQVAVAKFSRSEVQSTLEPQEEVELTLSGKLSDGTRFKGTDVIRVIDNSNKKK